MRRARELTGMAEDESALEKLRPAVAALSDLFTTERPGENFPDYAADPAKRVAYGLFFFPQSFVKCALALDPIFHFRGWKPAPGDGPVRVLDLGSASGPCGLAAALRLARETGRRVALTALDHSPAALGELRDIARDIPEIAARITVETHTADLRREKTLPRDLPPQDMLVAGFSLNEIFAGLDAQTRLARINAFSTSLNSDGVAVFLEPALRETASALRTLRDGSLAGPAFHAFGPDIAATPCPFLAAGGKFWDHEVREWTAPASLEFINRKLHRDTRVLKFTHIAFSRKPTPEPGTPGRLLRIVSPFEANKAGFDFAAITGEGRLVKVNIPTGDLSKNEKKRIAAEHERGDIVSCEDWKALAGENHFRVAEIGGLRTVARPGLESSC